MPYKLRRASIADADAIAAVFSPSFRLLTFLPALHTVAEDRWFIEHVILRECEVTLAENEQRHCRVSGPPGRGGAPSLRDARIVWGREPVRS